MFAKADAFWDQLVLAQQAVLHDVCKSRCQPRLQLQPLLGLFYLGDGVSEDIISMLSRFPDLSVVTRNSSFVYKGKPVDVRQIGRDLDVGYALKGSVRGSAHTGSSSNQTPVVSSLHAASVKEGVKLIHAI